MVRFCLAPLLALVAIARTQAGVYLTSYAFNQSSPPQVYTDEAMPQWYKLRVKILNVPNYPHGFHAIDTFNNSWTALQVLPSPGTYTAELYWLKYDSSGTVLQEIGPFSAVTISVWAPDTTAPTIPASLRAADITTSSLTLSWNPSFDAGGVTGYEVFRNGTSLGTVGTTSMNVTGLLASTPYQFTVRARDAVPNWSAQSTPLGVRTIIDTSPPTQPGNLASSSVTPVSAVVSWTPSSDNTGVVGYEIFRNGASIGYSATATFTFSGLSPSTTYQIQVKAFDGAGNGSPMSSALGVTTAAPDTTIPTVPTNLAIAAIDATSVNLTWSPSTDNIGVTGYEVFRNGISAGVVTGTTMALSGLTQLTLHTFTVRAKDGSNNWSANSLPVTGKTWQRILAASGTIWNNEEYDEGTEETTYNPTSDTYHFNLASSGSLRAFTTGSTDTRGLLDGVPASGGGAGNNFLFSTTRSAGGHTLVVAGENQEDQGDYDVFIDFKGASLLPTASFVASTLVGRAPLVVSLNGSASTDPDGQISSYAWDFDNNGTTDATGVAAVATYANNGTSPVTITTKLTVTDLDGGTGSTTKSVTVYPASSYSVGVDSGTASVPFQQSGFTVALVADAPPEGLQFSHWMVVSGSGSFAAGNAASTTLTVGSADTVVRAIYVPDSTPPSVPTGVTLADITGGSMQVSWTASSDNVGVTAYQVYRNGVLAATASGTSTTLTQLSGATVYQVTVRAKDAAGNLSDHSKIAIGKTWVRLYSSSGVITNGGQPVDENDPSLGYWYQPSTDWYAVYTSVGGTIMAFTTGMTDTRGSIAGVSASSGGEYANFRLTLARSAGFTGLEVRGEYEDTEGPYEVFIDFKPDSSTAPTAQFYALPFVGRAPLTVSFDGAASYDADGPLTAFAWDFQNDGTNDATGPRTSFTFHNSGTSPTTSTVKLTVTDLDAATGSTTQNVTTYPASSYRIEVEGGTTSAPYQLAGSSVDLVAVAPPAGFQFGAWSIVSGAGTFGNPTAASTTFTLSAADTIVRSSYVPDLTPPSAPTGLAHSSVFADSVVLTWNAATDNVGVAAYEVYVDGIARAIASGTTTIIANLSPWTSYQVAVRARDAAGNTSPHGAAVGVKTWQRLLASSSAIDNGASYDEENNEWSYNPSSNPHGFSVPQSGTVKAYTRGTTDTRGTMAGISASSGGEFDNFLITTARPAGNSELTVYGEHEDTEGPYHVYVDFYPGGAGIQAEFAVTPISGRTPVAVSFNGVASNDSAGTITSYGWDFDNNGTNDASGLTASTTYTNTGSSAVTYTAKLTIVGPSGSTSTTRTITVHPASSFGIEVENGTSSQRYQQSGGTVTLTAVAPPGGGTFQGWSIVTGAGSFSSGSISPTTFTMGSADTIVRANYGSDTTPPTTPGNLEHSELKPKSVSLVWRASTDNIGVTGYRIFDGPTLIGATTDLVFTVTGLTANTQYSYTVRAVDAAGNQSDPSNSLNVTTTQDYTADSDQDGIPDAIESVLGSNTSAPVSPDSSNQTKLNIHRPLK